MGRELIVYDPQTGRHVVIQAPESRPQYPPPAYYPQEYGPPAYPPDHYAPRRKQRRRRRGWRMGTLPLGVLVFVVGWIPIAAFDSAGGTWLVWGLGLVFMMVRRRDD